MLAASPIATAPAYHRHRPEQTALYAIIAEHYPRFIQEIERSGGHLPRFVCQEFADYLKCGLLEHGFLRVKCDGCLHEHLVAFSCKRRGFCPSCGARRMVESAPHLVDHVFPEALVRQWVLTFQFPLRFLFANDPHPLSEVLAVVQHAISSFVIRHSGLPLLDETPNNPLLAQVAGFSLHVATVCEAWQRSRLERLCRYITRPPIATKRLSVDGQGRVVYRYKHPFRDGSTHVILEPLDFIARLAALVPRPRLNLTRFHGVFAPNFKHRNRIVPRRPRHIDADHPPAPMTWAQRLKRVFAIDIKTCPVCGGNLRVIACIEDPPLIAKILGHVRQREALFDNTPRAPPDSLSLPNLT